MEQDNELFGFSIDALLDEEFDVLDDEPLLHQIAAIPESPAECNY